ncbi:MAG TPA: dihydrofolate reductase [Burkholderiaceae bacterium]|nr:dihydrofolate reductase [Burkholderiaceae bacterium]
MTRPTIKLVVAYSDNRAIGRDNALPWRLKADLAHFKNTTMGCPILMGRNTWDSLGRPLPGRRNLVISRNPGLRADGASAYPSLRDALNDCQDEATVFVIGGAQIYAQVLPMADEVIATEVHAHVDGDAFFPALPPDQWEEVERQRQPEESGLAFDFVVYRRR